MHHVAIIGAGRIGQIHAANAKAHPDLSLKYVADAIPAAAEGLAQKLGASISTVDEILADPSVEGVVIASSTDTHLDLSLRAVAAGKSVFCEKPLDLDLAKARSAASSLDGSQLFLGFNRRFDPNFRELHDRLESGEMGTLETLHIVSHDPAPPPLDYVKVSGGLFKDMTIHDFDMASWLLGEPVTSVFASAAAIVQPELEQLGHVDTAKVVLRTAAGRICIISNSRRSGYGYDQRIEAFCAKGLIRVGNVHASTVESWGADGSQSAPLQNFFLDRYAAAYRAEMDHFAAILSGSTRPEIGYRDGIAALVLAEAADESVRSRSVVHL